MSKNYPNMKLDAVGKNWRNSHTGVAVPCRCGRGMKTEKVTHPDAGIDFGVMGFIECCEFCAKELEDEMNEEIMKGEM